MQRENKWQDRFDERFYDKCTPSGLNQTYKTLKYVVDAIRNDFIQSELNRAVAEERETLTKELTKRAEQNESGTRFDTFVEVLAILNK